MIQCIPFIIPKAIRFIRNTENITSAIISLQALFIPNRPREKSEVIFQLFLSIINCFVREYNI